MNPPIRLSSESSAAENRRILQTAIDETAEAGGGVVEVPAGRYRTGGLQLRSGITLRLSEGATLLGSDREEDYDKHFIEHFSTPGGSRIYMALIYAEDCEHIAIEGPGTIDGQGGAGAWRCYPIPDGNGSWHKPSRPWGIRLWKCRDVRLEGYRLQSTAEWGHHLCDCERLTVRGLDIFNHANANNDGLDLDGCRDVLIEDCRIDADDDAFCVKSTGFRVNRNIHLRHCTLASRCRVIHIGSESSGLCENILIEHCAIVPSRARHKIDPDRDDNATSAIAIESQEGSVMRDFCFRDLTIRGCQTAFFTYLNLISPHRPKYAGHELKVGRISGLRYERIQATLSSSVASSFTAHTDAPPLEDLTFDAIDLSVPGSPGEYATAVPELQVAWHARAFGQDLPACGLYFRQAKAVNLRGLRVRTRSPDPRPDVVWA
jgi:polygalacturonase